MKNRSIIFWTPKNSLTDLSSKAKLKKNTSTKRVISTVLLLLCPKFRLDHSLMTTTLSTREGQYLLDNFQQNYWYIRRVITTSQWTFQIGYVNLRLPKWSLSCDVTWLLDLILSRTDDYASKSERVSFLMHRNS